ncbi:MULTISPECIES: DUF998 domain-containing protein [Micromonospora]|uniref:DUF998 domain-containing protein n=1 Tax=Micromonospora gifhornensis TaxID=84594 RepID=A0ABQ4IB53_9ACTN|nr:MULTISPECIES: DUF998 domain-containing protein [Micromonospora]PMR61455.1 DUF998 domain-containing protein [Verrucosispora sp. ts21]GIJ15136.1 hypothetical protein Vgi01_18200 [Micromonospora gifhornensis]
MRVVPRWALASAVAAPILLIGGWTLGAARQPGGFDQVTETISALAAVDATDRWIMTLGLAGLGLCHCVTAAGLRPLAPAGRALLALGGVGTLAVAAFPLPAGGEDSVPHTLAAAVAFGALALWPALAAPRTTTTRGPARRRAPWAALTVALALPVAWFVAELASGGERIGLAERVAAGAEALAPLLVVAGLRTASGRRRQRGTAARPPTA